MKTDRSPSQADSPNPTGEGAPASAEDNRPDLSPQRLDDRKAEATRVVHRLAALIEEHRVAALPLGIHFAATDLGAVIGALRDHAQGGPGLPVAGTRDEIHAHVLNRLFEELVEEPSNILYVTPTGPGSTRYDAMNVEFWIECLDLLEITYCR